MKAFFVIIILVCGEMALGQVTYKQVSVDYDSAWDFKNIRIIPIRAKVTGSSGPVSFGDAVRNGWVTISERGTASTENVHWLRINNHTDKPVYISSGEMVTGGRQDRIIARDTVLQPTGGDQYVSAMCVEEGRWSEKEKKFMYAGYTNPALRKVIDGSRNQVLIWKEIYDQLEQINGKSPTLAYASIRTDKKYLPQEIEYRQHVLEKFKDSDSSVVGIICVSGDKILGTDIFSSANLFYAELPSLISGYLETAILKGSPPDIEEKQVRIFADKLLQDEAQQESYCRKNGKLFKYQGKVFHISAY